MNSIYYELTEMALTSFGIGMVVGFCICILIYVVFLKQDEPKPINFTINKPYNWADDKELVKKFKQ